MFFDLNFIQKLCASFIKTGYYIHTYIHMYLYICTYIYTMPEKSLKLAAYNSTEVTRNFLTPDTHRVEGHDKLETTENVCKKSI